MTLYYSISFLTAILALLLLLKTPLIRLALDQPNDRSLHTNVTPRTGGLAIVIAVAVGWLAFGKFYSWMLPAFVLLCMSLVDDIRGLSVKLRLAAQLLVSLWAVTNLFADLQWWYLLVAVLAVTWMMNLYNFMDGSDGLAGGMAMFGFTSYALAAYFAGDMTLTVVSGVIASACLAFLLFNYHPASIFMGDAGSIPLGFLAGTVGLYGWHMGLWPIWLPILVFSPFILDASLTLCRRLLARERVWQAHKTHYYQRLVRMGWGHGKTAQAEYLLMFACGASAIILQGHSNLTVVVALICWALIYMIIAVAIDYKWKRFNKIEAGRLG